MRPPLGVVVAAMLLASGADGAEGYRSRLHVGSHNELVRMLRDRCAAAGLPPRSYGNLALKNPASADPGANSVSQGDLELLRARTVSLLKTWYLADPEGFVPEIDIRRHASLGNFAPIEFLRKHGFQPR